MSDQWRVRLTAAADRDVDDTVLHSLHRFGAAQAGAYEALLIETIETLDAGPDVLGNLPRDDLAPGFRMLRIARRGRRGRHNLLYRATGPMTVEVVRILHDSMDVARHLPPDPP